ncbi:hypothetical protein EST38_g14434 [Candolleomyces aberdarensis]|uniref:Uncharacterized protein n=1 Tax=Candolleomyces aberdarensis TaxID=2316362 RepID=A0A4Q2CZN9_9AGAR|nr:hypothetical protein EST38_g14434 [Candolleomyces aberdarensis]
MRISSEAAFRTYAGSHKPLEEHHIALMLKAFRLSQAKAVARSPPTDSEGEQTNETGLPPILSLEPKPRGSTANLRQRRIRKRVFELMGREEAPLGPTPITTVEPPLVKRWVRSNFKNRFGPSIDNFELYLDFEDIGSEERQQANAWNEAAAHTFAVDFIERYPEYSKIQDLIVKNFLTHTITLKKHYKQYMNDDPHANAESLKDKACRQRRMNRVARRRNICKHYIGDPTMNTFYQLFKTKISWAACSGDESEDGDSDRELLITTLPWRAARIRDWMQTLDNLDLVLRFEDGLRSTPDEARNQEAPSS